MAAVIRQLGLSRFDLGYATGRVPHEQKLATIELYGREGSRVADGDRTRTGGGGPRRVDGPGFRAGA
jgi:hypothetical protein